MLVSELLPFLEGLVYWDAKQILPTAPLVIPAGESRNIARYEKSGYLHAMTITFDNPLAHAQVSYMSLGQIRTFLIYPYILYQQGLVLPNGLGWWISKYDTTTNVYVIQYTPPSGSQLAFQEFLRTDLFAPAIAPLTVTSMNAIFLMIHDNEKLAEKLRYLNGGPDLVRVPKEKIVLPPEAVAVLPPELLGPETTPKLFREEKLE